MSDEVESRFSAVCARNGWWVGKVGSLTFITLIDRAAYLLAGSLIKNQLQPVIYSLVKICLALPGFSLHEIFPSVVMALWHTPLHLKRLAMRSIARPRRP